MNTNRDQFPLPEDLKVFLTVIRKNSFASAADELGYSPAYVSKRISVLETTLASKLQARGADGVTVDVLLVQRSRAGHGLRSFLSGAKTT